MRDFGKHIDDGIADAEQIKRRHGGNVHEFSRKRLKGGVSPSNQHDHRQRRVPRQLRDGNGLRLVKKSVGKATQITRLRLVAAARERVSRVK
ncbi:hypothetical protein AA101099_2817 [Neoasaia chiangmaiensis NBRC 101099]|nr:hypothetical protein AA101099_2817 [Neoasaia chiangmaiensis NBRC 101099]GEN14105.1 hypothetical protein NCH01_05360 [Neoasaia chiangmaiensis]